MQAVFARPANRVFATRTSRLLSSEMPVARGAVVTTSSLFIPTRQVPEVDTVTSFKVNEQVVVWCVKYG